MPDEDKSFPIGEFILNTFVPKAREEHLFTAGIIAFSLFIFYPDIRTQIFDFIQKEVETLKNAKAIIWIPEIVTIIGILVIPMGFLLSLYYGFSPKTPPWLLLPLMVFLAFSLSAGVSVVNAIEWIRSLESRHWTEAICPIINMAQGVGTLSCLYLASDKTLENRFLRINAPLFVIFICIIVVVTGFAIGKSTKASPWYVASYVIAISFFATNVLFYFRRKTIIT